MMTVTLPEGQQNGPDGKPKVRNVGLKDITDGTSTTLALVEKHDSYGWAVGGLGGSEFDVNTQPNYAENDALARKVYSGSVHRQGVHALFCEGSVRRLEPKIDRELWYAMVTRAGGERVRLDAPGLSPVLTAGKDVPLETRERLDRASANVQTLVDRLRKDPPAASKSKSPMNLFALEIATGKVTLVASEPDPGLDDCGSPSWTQDGRRILFDAQPRNHLEKTRLKAIDLAGDRWAIRDLGPGNCPTPSPGGDRVIFLQNQDQVPGAETGVWIMGADGTDRNHLGGYGRPKWSADGHQFLVISFSDPCEVTLIDDRPAKKSGPVKVPGYKIYSIPSWADEQTIVAVVGDENSTSGRHHRPGGRVEPLPTFDQAGPLEKREWARCRHRRTGLLAGQRTVRLRRERPRGMALYILDPGKPGPPRRLEPDAARQVDP